MPKLNTPIEIWGVRVKKDIAGNPAKDNLGHKVFEDYKIVDVFAEVSSKSGSMLYGRPADTILTKTTHKLVYRYENFPDLNEENFIKINGKRYNIEYCDNRNTENVWMDVFVSAVIRKEMEKSYGNGVSIC